MMREEVPGLARYEREVERADHLADWAADNGHDPDDPDIDWGEVEEAYEAHYEPDWAEIAADREADRAADYEHRYG